MRRYVGFSLALLLLSLCLNGNWFSRTNAFISPAGSSPQPVSKTLLPLGTKPAPPQLPILADSPDNPWIDLGEAAGMQLLQRDSAGKLAGPVQARKLRLNANLLTQVLQGAPLEGTLAARQKRVMLSLPLPEGTLGRFQIEESPVLDAALSAKFPEIKSYLGRGIDDPTAVVRFDWTPQGFHAMVLTPGGSILVHPQDNRDLANYVSYYGRDYRAEGGVRCMVSDSFIKQMDPALQQRLTVGPQTSVTNGTMRRTYRIAVATTQEYTNAPNLGGGTVAGALASLNTWVNGLTNVFDKEFSVRFTLVAQNMNVIFTAEPDGLTNGNDTKMLDEVRTIMRDRIGSANYDIGQVLGTGDSGVALTPSVCDNGDPQNIGPNKGGGMTGLQGPPGNARGYDLFIHEVGHQFGAQHSFADKAASGCASSREAETSWEPGAGVTYMSYLGSCTDNELAAASDPRFHGGSIHQVVATLNNQQYSCVTAVATGNNPPTVNAGTNFTIPRNTPFTLTATGTDADAADVANLTYCWEQVDAAGANFATPPYTDAADGANSTRPIFRPFAPTATPSRTFPSLNFILNNANVPPAVVGGFQTAENLPNVSRTMNFRCTIRDQRGGIGTSSMQVQVNSAAGPFAVTAPNTNVSLTGNSQQTVTWNVAGTNGAPVSCANVEISLSTDGGTTFPTILTGTAANSGTAQVTLPNVTTTQARIRVRAVGNIFFDISDANFSITAAAGCGTISLTPTALPRGTQGVAYNQQLTATGGTGNVTFALTNGSLPTGITLSGTGLLAGTPTAGLATNFEVTATDQNNCTGKQNYQLVICPTTLNIAPATLPNGTVGTAYPATTLSASGGTAPFTFTATGLPAGLTLSTTGALSGTPTAAGTATVMVTANDANGCTDTRAYTVTIAQASSSNVTVDDASANEGGNGRHRRGTKQTNDVGNVMTFLVRLSAPLAQPITVNYSTGGGTATPGQDFMPASGTLTFNPGDTVEPIYVLLLDDEADEPTENFFVNLSGAINATITDAQAVGSILNDATLVISSGITRQQGSAGSVSTICTVSGNRGTPAGAVIVEAVTVPTGITVSNITNTNGVVTALITASCTATPGANTITLEAGDADEVFDDGDLIINVSPNTAPTQGTYPDTVITAGLPITIAPSVSPSDNGTVTGVTVAASSGYAGALSINAVTGVISATPINSGSFTITVTATDNCGATSTRTFVLNVNAYGKGPIIASFTPPSGPFGTSVTISGFNLGTVRQVIFNNQPATFTIDSNTQITATVPFGATTGPISVVSTTGTATSATPFTVIRTK